MSARSNLKKWITGFSAVSSAVLLYPNNNNEAWETLRSTWDNNWDRRHAQWSNAVKTNNVFEKPINGEIFGKKSTDVKYHIILVRHGQYNIEDKTKSLTALGRQQAEVTGKRLQELGLPYTLIVQSTMTRAKETAEIIKNYLDNVTVEEDPNLVEGLPIPPDPPIVLWDTDINYHEDGPRIEGAFRKYFHRPDLNQKKDSYIILVCHGNVIKYFVCRALQLAPEGWFRFGLNHASITWISIRSNGVVTLNNFGNIGHMKPDLISS